MVTSPTSSQELAPQVKLASIPSTAQAVATQLTQLKDRATRVETLLAVRVSTIHAAAVTPLMLANAGVALGGST